MPARQPSRSHRSVPINVVVEKRTKKSTVERVSRLATNTITPINKGKSEWSESHRRHLMRLTVGVGTGIALLIWGLTFNAQIRHSTPTFFGDIARLVRDLRKPATTKKVTTQENEIRTLEQQVFPQFQTNTNSSTQQSQQINSNATNSTTNTSDQNLNANSLNVSYESMIPNH